MVGVTGSFTTFLLLAAPVVGATGETAPSLPVQRFEQNGLAIELTIVPQEGSSETGTGLTAGQQATVKVALMDAKSGSPVLGIRPKGWMTGRASEMVADEHTCFEKIRRLAGGRLGARAEVDLNRYVVVTMNHDKTISVIDPQVEFGATKLESLVTLPGIGADWALSPDQSHLYVTIPEEDAVAVIQTGSRKLIQIIALGKGSRPGRILSQPDSSRFWVGLDGTGQVAVLDGEAHRWLKTVPVGRGLHTLAAVPDGQFIYVTNSHSDTVSVIDTQTMTPVVSVPVGKTPVAVTYSSVARRIYVGGVNGADIVAIDPSTHHLMARIPVPPGAVALATEPQGRFVFAVNQVESSLFVIDTATNTVTAATSVVKDPDQIVFTQRYAYVRGIESEKFTLLDLREARNGKLVPLDVQAGRQAPSAAPQELGVAPMIVPTPEGNAVMIANAPDATLHYYQEGMMAPSGTFSNYRRMPRGILVLDRSLREVAPGVYQATVTLPHAGRFDVPVLLDQPRMSHCFHVAVQESPVSTPPDSSSRAVRLQARFGSDLVSAHVPATLSFDLLDAATQEPIVGLHDVQVLIVEPPGTWQQRRWAKEERAGRYVITQSFPHAGEYRLLVQSPSRHLRFSDTSPALLTVAPPLSMSPTSRGQALKP
ncbi:MAG: hypothetical protein ABS70_00620 [Nitrospira sp. SCN 59-13]|nr:MAG: hypothetical protein ABS70_00620 [Nitrospira sp. SCN 59-13]